jgi:hypothetical protein
MGTIGGYETTRELHRFREVVVYAARRSSETRSNYALKAFRQSVDSAAATVWELDEGPAKEAAAARQKEQLALFHQQKE